jgi:hypothetical protein
VARAEPWRECLACFGRHPNEKIELVRSGAFSGAALKSSVFFCLHSGLQTNEKAALHIHAGLPARSHPILAALVIHSLPDLVLTSSTFVQHTDKTHETTLSCSLLTSSTSTIPEPCFSRPPSHLITTTPFLVCTTAEDASAVELDTYNELLTELNTTSSPP